MNKFVAVGRVIAEPVYRQAGGVEVCDFKISVRTRGKNDQGYPNSIIVRCTLWRRLAELAKSMGLLKGSNVGVVGMLDVDSFVDKEGQTRTTLTVDVDDIDFIRTSDMPSKPKAYERGEADDTTDMPAMVQASDPDCPF